MGFHDVLAEILGGFNTVRRIDEEGFDFREQQKQRDFQRERERIDAGQADETRGLGLASEFLAGAETPDAEAAGQFFGPEVDSGRREALITAALGKARQSKSALKSQDLFNRRNLALLGGDLDLDRDEARAGQREELAELEEKLRRERTLSPADQARFEFLEEQGGLNRASRERAASTRREDRLFAVDEFNPETGMNERKFIDRETAAATGTGERPGFGKMGQTQIGVLEASNRSLRLGEGILSALGDEEFGGSLRDVLGPVAGRFRTLEAAAGAGHPAARFLQGEIKGLASLQPKIHGFRAVAFARDIEKNLLQTGQTPEALAAAIQGLLQASRAVAGEDLYQFMPGDFKKFGGIGFGGGDAVDDFATAFSNLSPEEQAFVRGEQ